jgi:hypothetical protein
MSEFERERAGDVVVVLDNQNTRRVGSWHRQSTAAPKSG